MVFVKGACYYFNVAQKVRSNCSQRPRLAAVAHIEFNECSGLSGLTFTTGREAQQKPWQQTSCARCTTHMLFIKIFVFDVVIAVTYSYARQKEIY